MRPTSDDRYAGLLRVLRTDTRIGGTLAAWSSHPMRSASIV
jgi:hypothetical protein